MATKKQRTTTEWVGGIFSIPAYVTGEGAPYRPETLVWLSPEGAILGHASARPGELFATACDSLVRTMQQPLVGPPRKPSRLRVAWPELAETLRAGQLGIEVVCAPTPEIDVVAAAMKGHVQEDDRSAGAQPYLAQGHSQEAIASLFRAAAALFRAKPWKSVPDDSCLLSVTVEKLGVESAALSVIGQMGQSHGFLLFSCLDDFDDFTEISAAVEDGDEPLIPPHVGLSFERGADLGPAFRKEVAEHGFEVANSNAYPWITVVEDDALARPPIARELMLAEAIALALPKLLKNKRALLDAWKGGSPVQQTIAVETHAGTLEVSFTVPYPEPKDETSGPEEVLAALAELDELDEEFASEARKPLEEELIGFFLSSPEAKGVDGRGYYQLVMDFASNYFDTTIAGLRPGELREILYDLFPRKVSIGSSEATSVITELRAFYSFLERECKFGQAAACLRVLGGDAIQRLEAALSNSSNFGMAKSLIMGGASAGFDMSSKEGIEAWMRQVQSVPLPPSFELPGTIAGNPIDKKKQQAQKQARKSARKAERKARKNNR